MNKNYFDSYLCNTMAEKPAQQKRSAEYAFSQHNITSQNMCFDMMCKMMMML
ncbi:hypothetical protein [Chryseobacterium sp.]|uniref:hypothetical protein n=1 Tax=Chryseobacterium sp. TaxID=1871047 RepID=UPI00262023F0|nr:hypothetical protein [Chryseobacterium sp.]